MSTCRLSRGWLGGGPRKRESNGDPFSGFMIKPKRGNNLQKSHLDAFRGSRASRLPHWNFRFGAEGSSTLKQQGGAQHHVSLEQRTLHIELCFDLCGSGPRTNPVQARTSKVIQQLPHPMANRSLKNENVSNKKLRLSWLNQLVEGSATADTACHH